MGIEYIEAFLEEVGGQLLMAFDAYPLVAYYVTFVNLAWLLLFAGAVNIVATTRDSDYNKTLNTSNSRPQFSERSLQPSTDLEKVDLHYPEVEQRHKP